jgi:4'-phosphopantetheinyl transferase EntD
LSEITNRALPHSAASKILKNGNLISIQDLLTGLQAGSQITCVILSTDVSHDYALPPEEQRALTGKEVAKRRDEFISGRAAANRAMHQLGIQSPGPVRKGALGEPIWPEGIVGSITHSYPWTIAVVGRSSDVVMLGIDLENISGLNEQEISEQICIPPETSWIQAQHDPVAALGRIFSGKEALYKALSPQCHRWFDFKDARLSWMPERDCFSAELRIDLGRQFIPGYKTEVRTHSAGDWVFAYVMENHE